jgi:hypothetical protein
MATWNRLVQSITKLLGYQIIKEDVHRKVTDKAYWRRIELLEVHCYASNEQAWVSTTGEQTTEEDRMDPDEGKDKPEGLVMTLNQPRGQMRSQWIYRQRRQVMRPVGSAVDGKKLGGK